MFFSFIRSIIKYGTLEIIDPDGKLYTFGSSKPFCCIKIHNNKTKKRILLNPELCVGEAFVDGELTIEKGTFDDFMDIITKNSFHIDNNPFHFFIKQILSKLKFFKQFNSIPKSYKNVAHHYDIDEKIYKLFLDKDMQYSCGYFHNDNISLDQAQIDKKNHLIKKLNINDKNMKVLDIGSGWGGLAIQIAKDTGAYVKGITLSKNQYEFSKNRLKEEGLENLVDFELIDYRDLNGKFDRIISVGMFEHVGLRNFNNFFKCSKNLLKDDGLMLIHSIGSKYPPYGTNPWIKKYIFPGGYIPTLSEVSKVLEKQELWVTDIEIWRMHYAKTLKHWRDNFNKNRSKISSILDEKFCRMWEFYLSVSEYSFRNMGNMVFQIQITKNQESAPLTRNYIYN